MMTLYGYFRSSTSYRTRIALNLKNITYEQITINLAKDQQLEAAFKTINPQGLVPVLTTDDLKLYQSPAILEWLEEVYPHPPLLPKDPTGRMQVRALSAMIGCDIHPINNRRILQYLRHELNADEPTVMSWCQRWIAEGFEALEKLLMSDTARGNFCYGDAPTIADCYLIPQVSSAMEEVVPRRGLRAEFQKHHVPKEGPNFSAGLSNKHSCCDRWLSISKDLAIKAGWKLSILLFLTGTWVFC